MNMVRFGPAGNSASFYEQGYKSSSQMPKWLHDMGLRAYEYQCNKGVNVSKEKAQEIGAEAKKYDIALSIHAPYFISLSSCEEEKRTKSVVYILQSLEAASWMGAKRIVIHPGSLMKRERNEAWGLACTTLKEALKEADERGLTDIYICPETMGKINQIGTLQEIIDMCRMDERLLPTVDFGHIHARGQGCLKGEEDFNNICDLIENELGAERLRHLHCHFSRVEYTGGGEKKHWTLADTAYGPEFEPLARVICKRQMEPIIICESRDNMAEDAVRLKDIYEEAKRRCKNA